MTVNKDLIASFVRRIENLEQEKKDIQADIKDVYSEAKSQGFDKKALKTVIKLRRMNSNDRDEFEFLVDSYKEALK